MKENSCGRKWPIWVAVFLLTTGSAVAAVMVGLNYNVKSHVTASGDNSASTNYSLVGDVGEAVAGNVLSSATYSHRGGFTSTLVPVPVSTITLSLNALAFKPADTMVLSAAVTAVTPPNVADVWIVLQWPDASYHFYDASLGGLTTVAAPTFTNFPIPDFNGALFTSTFVGDEQIGTYNWFVAMVQPGMPPVPANFIGVLAQSSFTFSPF